MVQNAILQETGVPAHLGPLTTLDGDCSRVPTIFLTIPRELVERILLLLDLESLLKCKLVNREFNKIIQSSILLQYFLACKVAGVIDTPRSPLSVAGRLEALLKREDGRRKLKPVYETTIKTNFKVSSTQLTGGKLFCAHNSGKDLSYCQLPSSPQDNPQWIPAHGPEEGRPGISVRFGTAVYEHDLIINVISSDIGNQAVKRYSHDLVLLKFSTGDYHPLARHPQIHLQRSPKDRLFLSSSIVGDNLALVLQNQDDMFSKLVIFDWKTGHKRLVSDPLYISALIFTGILTNSRNTKQMVVHTQATQVPSSSLQIIFSHFEVWHLPSHPHPNPPVQILSLKIPAISIPYSLGDFVCHGVPNPYPHSIPYFPPRPFFPSPENSIIVVCVCFEDFDAYLDIPYMLIMHRHGLLDMIKKWTLPSLLEQQDLPSWLTNRVTVHEIADPDWESVIFGAQSKSVSITPHLRLSPVSSRPPTTLSTSRYDFPQVKWADWGPPISQWSTDITGWQTDGQRYAFLTPISCDRRKSMISVMDFNPHNFRRNAEMMARLGEGEDSGAHSNNEKDEELEVLDHGDVFSEEVYMGLKCVVYHAPDEYDCDRLFMDEERLLIYKHDRGRNVGSFKVL